MEHAQTIAMARNLLAEGRAGDVVQMVDPLLEPVDAPAASTGQIMLRALRARVEVVHRDNPERTLDLLPPLGSIGDLCTCVRAEVALWRGWAYARRHADPDGPIRAFRLLQEAEGLFDTIHDPCGRCWALLGQAQAFFAIDEYALMRHTLREASSLAEQLRDEQIDRWHHELSIPVLRFEGHYEEAKRHVDALRKLGTDWKDQRIQGYASAHAAALYYDLGKSPTTITEAAKTAAKLLRRVEGPSLYPLLAAYHAHVGALLRRGDGAAGRAVVDEIEDTIPADSPDQAHLQALRARIALHHNDEARAASLIDALTEQISRLPHGLSRSHVAMLRGKFLIRRNELDEAYTWMQRARRSAQETGHRENQLRAVLALARIAAGRSDLDAARAHLADAAESDEYFSVLPFAVRRYAAEGTVSLAVNQFDEAKTAYRQALSAAEMMEAHSHTTSLCLLLDELNEAPDDVTLVDSEAGLIDPLALASEGEISTSQSSIQDGPETDSLGRTSPSDSVSSLGAALAQASFSLPLVVDTWLRAVSSLLPDRWIGVYRLSSEGSASLVHERGNRPDGLSPPSRTAPESDGESVRWLQLHSSPALVFGVEVDSASAQAWEDVEETLRNWLPLVRLALERALPAQRQAPSSTPESDNVPVEGLVAESDVMQTLVDRVRRIRTSHSPVLISGEQGAGKRRLARAVHATSPRADGPFRPVAGAPLQHEPVAERLFGTVDADGALVPGAVHDADGGTLVIEDVDALPLAVQSSLLRLLEEGTVVPEGATEATPVDVRLVATTTENLDEQVRNDHFRPALAERLNVLTLRMPPLRERRADIPLLVRQFLDGLRPGDSTMVSITQPAMEALLRYDWPGNVRQLRNELERALVHVSSEPAPTIDRTLLLDQIVEEAKKTEPPQADDLDAILHPNQSLSDVLSRTEAALIRRVLRACDGQVTASADVLGLSRQGLYKKMKRLDIDASSFQSTSPEPSPAS